jgi:hypothetical protein
MRLLLTAALAACTAAPAAAQDKVTNPEYASWAAFPKGTSIRVRYSTGIPELDSMTVKTLKEVGPDKVVLEVAIENSKSGAKPTTWDVPKSIVLLPGVSEEKLAKGVGAMDIPSTAVDLPPEPVSVFAGKYTAIPIRWEEKQFMGGTTTHTTWLSDKVPGLVVKKVSSSTRIVGARSYTTTFTYELIEVKKPVVVAPVALATAQDKVPNPEYTSWAAFPKGTGIRVKSTTAGIAALDKVFVTTLKELGADKLVLETVEELSLGGTGTPTTREVPKEVSLPAGMTREQFAKGWGLIGVSGTSTESPPATVTVPAGEYFARSVTWTGSAGFGTGSSTTWLSDRVPGLVVKKVVSTTVVRGKTVTTTRTATELVQVKKP